MAIIEIGQEPENIKKRIDTLFAKLDGAYPDRVIIGLQKDHKKWDETARDISKHLGYESKNSFLTAYGYRIERAETGRPKTTNCDEVIEELKSRYPEGTEFTKLGELLEANPDLKGKLKTLSNESTKLFGMTMKEYFLSIGLIKRQCKEKSENIKKEKKPCLSAEEKYALELDIWRIGCQKIENQRKEELSRRIEEEKKALETPCRRIFDEELQGANRQKAESEKRKAELEGQIAKLGVFDFIKKKNLKKELEKTVASADLAEKRIKSARQTLKNDLAKASQKLLQREGEIREEVESELPMPQKPRDPIAE